jgi:hypothetical protein
MVLRALMSKQAKWSSEGNMVRWQLGGLAQTRYAGFIDFTAMLENAKLQIDAPRTESKV